MTNEERIFQSEAIDSLEEAAELVALVEDLMHPASLEALTPVRASGMRVTLRNVKRNILELREALSTRSDADSDGAATTRPLRTQVEREEQHHDVQINRVVSEATPEPVRRRILQSPISMSVSSTEDVGSGRFTSSNFPGRTTPTGY